MKKTLVIGHLYPKQLNLYGDTGNILAISHRVRSLSIDTRVVELDFNSTPHMFDDIDILFMGGGSDSMQKEVHFDFLQNKRDPIFKFFNRYGVGLFVCGGYQLLGNYYRPFSGPDIRGISLLDFTTSHYGLNTPRCVGNVVVEISTNRIPSDFSKYLVGFENHGGRTFLKEGASPLGVVVQGVGNNEKQKTEGVFEKNFIGTYLHGPILPKNPHLTDFIVTTALKNRDIFPGILPAYSDFEKIAHRLALKLKK
jgi:CobQ-like glutamine amidotransferase family enzyme